MTSPSRAGLRRLEQVLERMRAINMSYAASASTSASRSRARNSTGSPRKTPLHEMALDMRLLRDRSQTHRLLRSADLRIRERPHSRDLILDLETREDLEAILQAVSFATRILYCFDSVAKWCINTHSTLFYVYSKVHVIVCRRKICSASRWECYAMNIITCWRRSAHASCNWATMRTPA